MNDTAGTNPTDGSQEPIIGALLRERSRRTTVTTVLDHLRIVGGRFAEHRADGSAWSVSVPPPHREASER
ncbi:hypothetical protein [Saccharothrix variisporea]|uniref:Uncharacterized protein n=1 Tax=Saccharothrix variisporea TaxID=543527 RepID=A0A495XBX0_9PSEU|nr:hypothetical protein [Saccharothrix variisporea]RKT70615.1 hypothetical protein DFJ66_3885 [Saccharothrix variisporea]